MNYFKKFSDFCCAFIVMYSGVFIFWQFMSYTPNEPLSILARVKAFIFDTSVNNYIPYFSLIFLLVFSLAISLILERYPRLSHLSFIISLLPFFKVTSMFVDGNLYGDTSLYFFMIGIHIIGNFLMCIKADPSENRKYAILAADLIVFFAIFLYAYIFIRFNYTIIDQPNALSSFDKVLYMHMSDGSDLSTYPKLLILYACLLLIRFILKDIHFFNAITALIPPIYVIYLFNTDDLGVHAGVSLAVAIVYCLTRFTIMISPKAYEKLSELENSNK